MSSVFITFLSMSKRLYNKKTLLMNNNLKIPNKIQAKKI